MVGFYLMIDTICHCFYFFFFYLTWSDGIGCHDLNFLNAEFQVSFSLSSFILIKPVFSSSSLSNIRVILSAYLRLIFLLAVLIPACDSSNPAFCMTRSAQNLNKQAMIHSLVLLSQLEPDSCSMPGSNCCFQTLIQVSQETGQVV